MSQTSAFKGTPWKLIRHEMGYDVVFDAYNSKLPDGFISRPVPVCRVTVGYNRTDAEALAFARLIVAAPDLLLACKALLEDAVGCTYPDTAAIQAVELAEVAIDKVLGRS